MSTLADQVRAVAIDLDGTLVDSAPDLVEAVNRTLVDLDLERLAGERVTAMIGNGYEALVERALVARLGGPPPADLRQRARAAFRRHYRGALFADSRLYPGVMEGLEGLREAGVRLCCVTNKAAEFTGPLLRQARLADYFDLVLCPGQPDQRKPSPWLLEQACRQLGVAADELLMVGDSRVDIAAARAAGVAVAQVAYGYDHDEHRSADDPDWVIYSLADVVLLPPPRSLVSAGWQGETRC